MEKLIKIHRDSDQLDFKSIWKDGLFVFDSNVLLDLYRLPQSAKEDLIKVLLNKDFNKRIWIGFQVLLEFLNNRYSVIGDQKTKFSSVKKIIDEAISKQDALINEMERNLSNLKLKQRHSLINPDKFINEESKNRSKKIFKDFLEELEKLEKKQSDVDDTDKIKNIVLEIFKDKIGAGFNLEKLNEIYKLGKERYENEIPPGYKDIAKEGSHFYEDKNYIRKYGDLILWFEIMEMAKKDKPKHVILVTGDVKQDWWLEKRGKKLGPRIELLNEIYTELPELDTFYLYDTPSFLRYAKQEIDDQIKESSIDEAQQLIDQNKISQSDNINIYNLLSEIKNNFEGLNMVVSNSVRELPIINCDFSKFQLAIFEILFNIMDHAKGKFVRVIAKENENTINLKFRSLLITGKSESEEGNKGNGFDLIKSALTDDRIDFVFYNTEKNFIQELFIPKNTGPNIG